MALLALALEMEVSLGMASGMEAIDSTINNFSNLETLYSCIPLNKCDGFMENNDRAFFAGTDTNQEMHDGYVLGRHLHRL